MTIRVIADGGGVQSNTLVILASQGIIDFPLALFANVGDDSEHPDTIAYVEHIQRPYAQLMGRVEVITVQKTIGDQPDTILQKIKRTARSEVIPVRSSAGGPPMSRSCTWDFKIETMGRWLKAHGAGPDSRATVAMGISLDEIGRAGRSSKPWEEITYPLLAPIPGYTDRALRRVDCERITAQTPLPAEIADGLRPLGPEVLGEHVWRQLVTSDFQFMPVPAKSSCFFCPFHSVGHWHTLRRTRPDLFEKSCQIEETITRKSGSPRYLTRFGIPLREVIRDGVDELPIEDADPLGLEMGCTSGACAI